MNRLLILAALAALSNVSQAATVIDFNDNPQSVYWKPVVYSDGFVATEINNEYGSSPLGTNVAIDGYGISNGTVHLDSWTNDSSDSVWSLTNASGASFNLTSFDFASGYPGNDETVSSLTVTGMRSNGTTVSEVFTPATQSFETLTLNGSFTGLSSVRFDAYGESNRAAYDNITVTAAVPEPSIAALFAVGLVGISLARRKRQA